MRWSMPGREASRPRPCCGSGCDAGVSRSGGEGSRGGAGASVTGSVARAPLGRPRPKRPPPRGLFGGDCGRSFFFEPSPFSSFAPFILADRRFRKEPRPRDDMMTALLPTFSLQRTRWLVLRCRNLNQSLGRFRALHVEVSRQQSSGSLRSFSGYSRESEAPPQPQQCSNMVSNAAKQRRSFSRRGGPACPGHSLWHTQSEHSRCSISCHARTFEN